MSKVYKIIKVSLLVLLCLGPGLAKAEQSDTIQVILDEKRIEFSEAPTLINNVTMVQFRPLFEQLNMQVTWDEQLRRIEASGKEKKIVLQLNSSSAKVDETTTSLESAPVLINGSAFVPLRFIGESLNAKVEWNEASRIVTINTHKDAIKELPPAKPAGETAVEKPGSGKQKKDSYTVDKITNYTGWSTGPTYSPKFSSLVVGRNQMAYLLEDLTPKGAFDFNHLVTIMEVNLLSGEVQRRASVDETFQLKYTNSNNETITSKTTSYLPKWLKYDWKSDKLIIGGINFDEKGKVVSFHERFPKYQLLSYKKDVNSSPLVNDFVSLVDDKETLMFSDLANRDFYLMPKGGEPKRIVHMDLDSNVKLGKTKAEALLTEDALYLFDAFTSSLYKVLRESGDVKVIYSAPELTVDSVITHDGKFYISCKGSIYELDLSGHWSSFIDSKQLIYPDKMTLGNFLMFAFDEQENIIVFNGDRTGVQRINR